jgi:recombinational DNA repair protein (RecF pathway)
MIWLSRFRKTYGAGLVLEALMGVADSGQQADQIFDFSLAWLEIFHQKKVRSFYLCFSWVVLIIAGMHRRPWHLPWHG